MIQDALFSVPVSDAPVIPPSGTKPPMLAEPLGPCVKCGKDAILASPSGMLYCVKCGQCGRMDGQGKKSCYKNITDFVWHDRLKIWCCPCVVKFEIELPERIKEA
jgi:hypothetical protein